MGTQNMIIATDRLSP